MSENIYLDNAATTPIDTDVKEILINLLDVFHNPSQPYSPSSFVKKKINEARKIIADCINASPEEIFFTSGGTESNNTVIYQMLNHKKKKSIIISDIEHHSVINPCKFIKKMGYIVKNINVNSKGYIDSNDFINTIDENTVIASIMYANNEIGTIQNIKKLASIAHEKGILFHTDAVQAVGHLHLDVKELDVDFLSASAHKFNGPKGIGFLYVKKGINFSPLIYGGAQELNMRAGTENAPLIYAMAIALKKNLEILNSSQQHLNELYDLFIKKLKLYKIDFVENSTNDGLPGLVNISINNQNGETLLHRLDLKKIQISTGSACDSVNNQVSHVIKALNVDKRYSEGTIRISFGKENTKEEAIKIADELNNIING